MELHHEKAKVSALKNAALWQSWQWQIQSRIQTPEHFLEAFPKCAPEVLDSMSKGISAFPMALTPYYASLIQVPDPSDPIFRMAVPQSAELLNPPFLKEDPLEEESSMPVPGLVRRYPDRVLLLVTTLCAAYCRYCTRKRLTARHGMHARPIQLEEAASYIAAHPDIKEVLLSGGDPLTLSTERLETVLASLRKIETLQVIRIGTRVPVTLPMRITNHLLAMLQRYHPIWINTHFNHPREITPEAAAACQKLADAGIPLGNQTVLLRGINDHPLVLEELFRELIRIRVRPYYLLQCDLVRGVEHFRTPLSRGIEIMEWLRGRLSGIAIPTYVIDLPGKGGKIPVLPNYVVSTGPTHTILRNSEGVLLEYPEPS